MCVCCTPRQRSKSCWLFLCAFAGIGWSTESKLQDVFNAKTCKDLLQIPMQNLSKVVGPKTAENIVK